MVKKYITIDFLKGIAIFMMTFLHILTNIYDMSWVDTRLNDAPVIAIILLLLGLYMGAWAGLFLMLNAMGNMISMYKGFEKGKTAKATMKKQVIGGFILLIFAFLAEGLFQYYGVFVSYYEGNPDPFRLVWHAYTMETIHTIAICVILNGIVQSLLSRNGGHKKIKRNMIIYAILAVISIVITQPIWDWAKTIIDGYPDIMRPTIDSNFSDYVIKLILLPLAGSPEPIFPFFAVSCIGSILGMAMCREKPSQKFIIKGIGAGIALFIIGIIVGIIVDAGMDGFLPLDSFSRFVGIGGGIGYRWVPWIMFITGGQILLVCTMLRLVEFRGKSEKFAQKTTIIRRFGMVPFSIYCWHRIVALVPLEIINQFWHQDSPTVYCECYTGYQSLALIAIVMLFIHGLLKLWEKGSYIGGLEWMMSSIAVKISEKKKDNSFESRKWYQKGAMDVQQTFYNVEWIDIFPEDQIDRTLQEDSKLATIFAFLGLLFFPCGSIALDLALSAEKTEGKHKKNQIAKIWAIFDIVLVVILIIVFYNLTFTKLGISL